MIFKLKSEYDRQNFALHLLASLSGALFALALFGAVGLRVTCLTLGAIWIVKELVLDGHFSRIVHGQQTREWWLDLWTDWFSQLTPLIVMWLWKGR